MKKNKTPLLISTLLTLIILACNQAPKEKTIGEEIAEYKKSEIDLAIGAKPKEFTVKTTDGSLFSSKELKGKYWVVFVYDKSYLTITERYDMPAELNETYQLFGDKIEMIGLINGFSEDENALQKQLAKAKFDFRQIDNTQAPNKERKVKDNVFCTPAKIIINPNGKVVYNGCGGNIEKFDLMLAAFIKEEKL